jgi:hypothetical protein
MAEALSIGEQVIDEFSAVAEARHAAKLALIPDCEEENLGAHAGFPTTAPDPSATSRDWTIDLYRGSVTPYLSADVTRWLVCHEIGHFMAGFPFKPFVELANLNQWHTVPASEGAADYFSTKECLTRVWEHDRDNAAYRALVPQLGRERCDASWARQDERDICYRSIVVANEVMRFWGNGRGENVDITTPSTHVAPITFTATLEAQCRFDTLVAGALCSEPMDLAVIPGLVPTPWDGTYGPHSAASERHAMRYSCDSGVGARPACWFKKDMPDTFDCEGVTEVGECQGDEVVQCDEHAGFTRYSCPAGCILVEEPGTGVFYPTCAEEGEVR